MWAYKQSYFIIFSDLLHKYQRNYFSDDLLIVGQERDVSVWGGQGEQLEVGLRGKYVSNLLIGKSLVQF